MNQQYCNSVNYVIDKYREKTAITYIKDNNKNDKLKFEDILKYIKYVEQILSQSNIKKGDRVAIAMDHSPYPVILGISLAYLNVTSVLIDNSLPLEEKQSMIKFADVRMIFTSRNEGEKFEDNIIKQIPTYYIENWKIKKLNNSIEICKNITKDPELDVISILFSSGTTGKMKGIKMTYESMMKSRKILLRFSGIKSYMSYLIPLPFNHVAGYYGAMGYFLTGCELGFIENVNPTKLQKALLEYQPYYFCMVPKVFEVMEQKIRNEISKKGKCAELLINTLLNVSGLCRRYLKINIGKKMFSGITEKVFGKNIYGLGTGASPCKATTAKFFLDLGLEWSNMYATTETNVPIVSVGVNDRYVTKSLGNVYKNPEIQIKIMNPNEKGIGEIGVKTELIMKGYFREPRLTEQAFSDGYFKTGDYGYIDRRGYLYVTGRIKESIILQTGKKVSPVDVDNYYLEKIKGINLASKGVTKEGEGYDEIHIFIENDNYTNEFKQKLIEKIESVSRKAPSMYKIEKIYFIDEIPRTSVGKVKRFALTSGDKNYDKKQQPVINTNENTEDVQKMVINIIRQVLSTDNKVEINLNSNIKLDIGLDSLKCFEVCTLIQKKFGCSVEGIFNDDTRVSDIIENIKANGQNEYINDAAKYPLKRTNKEKIMLRMFMRLSKKFWNLSVTGLEQIDFSEKYIFCPNHESHFDGMWVLGCLPDSVQKNFCSMAADYLFDSKIYKPGIKIMGGIPVHRNANTTMAMKRIYECITKEGMNLLIHPEGTRTRDGSLGKFKLGAAEIASETNTKIIPIGINGARKIFPPNKKMPYLLKKGEVLNLKIHFGQPINPDGKTALEITREIEKQIVRMKEL